MIVSSTSRAETLSMLPLFQGIEKDVLADLAAAAHVAQHNKSTVIFAHDQPVSGFSLILDGWCGATHITPEGDASILQLFHHSDYLFEPGLEASPFNLQALTPVKILKIPVAAVRGAFERSKTFANAVMAAASRRCQELRDHIDQLITCNAEQRVGNFILYIRMNTDASDRTHIALPFEKSLVAAYLNIKPETLSRILLGYKEKGFTIARNRVMTPHPHALCGYCNASLLKQCPEIYHAECPLLRNGK